MSLRSMTGHGHGSAAVGGLRVDVTISSVNRRQLDLQISVPSSLRRIEPMIHEIAASRLHRGRIQIDVQVRTTAAVSSGSVRVNEALAGSYAAALRNLARHCKLEGQPDINLVAQLPGVVQYMPVEENTDKVWPLLEKSLKEAMARLQRMQSAEGVRLLRDLDKRISILEKLSTEIRKRVPVAAKNFRAALAQRLKDAGAAGLVDADRLTREAVMFADRCDITEELTRIESHVGQAREIFRRPEPAGKAIDFLAQEFNREINTIGSKANDAGIARHVVTFKTELERLREQAQNIE